MVRKTKEEAENTRKRIIEAAISVFYEKGVSATSLEDIAAAAGVTRGALYWHFGNKLAIFTAIQNCTECEACSAFLEHLDDKSRDPSATFEEFTADFLVELEQDEELQRIFVIHTLKCDYSGEMEAFLHEDNHQREEFIKVFEEAFKKMKATGHIREDIDPRLTSLSFFCYFTGIVTSYVRQPQLFNLKKQARPLIRQFLTGLK